MAAGLDASDEMATQPRATTSRQRYDLQLGCSSVTATASPERRAPTREPDDFPSQPGRPVLSSRGESATDEFDYGCNRAAASLRRQSADTVGVVITNVANPVLAELLSGFETKLIGAGFSALIVNTGQDPTAQAGAVAELRRQRVVGLAIVPARGAGPAFVETLRGWQLPHVLMARRVIDAPTHYVGADESLGGYRATAHLLDHGARTIAYLGGPIAAQSRCDRLAGAARVLAERGLDPRRHLVDTPGESSGAAGLALGQQLLRTGPIPDAIICHSDQVAFGVYRALRQVGHKAWPRIVGYDDYPTASLWQPALTSVSTKAHDLGRLAAQNLLQQLRVSAQGQLLTTITEPELVIRDSCGDHPAPTPGEERRSRCRDRDAREWSGDEAAAQAS